MTKSGGSNTYSDSQFPVFFDTGATLSYLPSALVDSLGRDLGGSIDSSINMYVVPCNQQGSIDFTFGDFTLKVPLTEFLWEIQQGACILGADKANDGSYLLGDSFLRSAYVVFDQETPALHFAPYVNCGSNLQKIPLGQNAAARFTGECKAGSGNSGSGSSSGSGGNNQNDAGRPAPNGSGWLVASALVAAQIFMSFL